MSMCACVSTYVLSDAADALALVDDVERDVDAIALDIILDARTTRAEESADMRKSDGLIVPRVSFEGGASGRASGREPTHSSRQR
jgi:hypothetical protein